MRFFVKAVPRNCASLGSGAPMAVIGTYKVRHGMLPPPALTKVGGGSRTAEAKFGRRPSR